MLLLLRPPPGSAGNHDASTAWHIGRALTRQLCRILVAGRDQG